MSFNDNGKKTLYGFIWRFFERCGAQGVSLIVSIILARLLEPNVYGIVAIVNIFIAVLQVFVDSGLGNALIQKQDADDLDFSSVFYFNLILCILIYGILYLIAPLIAIYFSLPDLCALVRIMGISIIISGVKNIQQAYVCKTMQFKKFFFSTLGGTFIAAIVGVIMAYSGFGVWALVIQTLVNMTIDTIILWITVRWRPKWCFSFSRLSLLLSYGVKLLISGLIDTIYTKLRNLLIGKVYSTEELAFYNKGDLFPNTLIVNINSSIDSVLFPMMSEQQQSRENIKNMVRKSIQVSTYIVAPIMMGLFFSADVFIELLLTEKWMPCVFFLRIFCVTYLFWPIHTANLNAIKAMGKSDIFLQLEIVKKIFGIVLMLSTLWISVKALALSCILSSIFSQIVNVFPNKKLLSYGYFQQMKDILPSILISVFMGLIIYFFRYLNLPLVLIFLFQILVGLALYVLMSYIFKVEPFLYLVSIVAGAKRS